MMQGAGAAVHTGRYIVYIYIITVNYFVTDFRFSIEKPYCIILVAQIERNLQILKTHPSYGTYGNVRK